MTAYNLLRVGGTSPDFAFVIPFTYPHEGNCAIYFHPGAIALASSGTLGSLFPETP